MYVYTQYTCMYIICIYTYMYIYIYINVYIYIHAWMRHYLGQQIQKEKTMKWRMVAKNTYTGICTIDEPRHFPSDYQIFVCEMCFL